jgi:hypothetical protein
MSDHTSETVTSLMTYCWRRMKCLKAFCHRDDPCSSKTVRSTSTTLVHDGNDKYSRYAKLPLEREAIGSNDMAHCSPQMCRVALTAPAPGMIDSARTMQGDLWGKDWIAANNITRGRQARQTSGALGEGEEKITIHFRELDMALTNDVL